MNTFRRAWATCSPGFGVCVVALLALGAATTAQGQPATEDGMQVLTRGPVHEAFAMASMTGATAGIVVAKTPYDPVTEMPPDQRPEGANVAWIPGYWSYDDDRSDFIWVSGVWRDLPPGRQWVPGYWTPVRGGSQWISGFWGAVAQTEVTYLPQPPAPLEAGPSSPPPMPDNVWTSGSWVWQETRYDWQPGYWVPQQPDWVWSPAHYVWTPRGYVYVPGYWDHDIMHRGMMFAPVYYDRPVYRRAGYAYSPSIIIDLGLIAASLFIQPRSNHYYYGDYYDKRYERRGFHPWYSKEARRHGDDPLYMHYRSVQMRQDAQWDTHIREQFSYRRQHVEARPPQTLALQVNIFKSRKADTPESMFIGRSFAEAAQSKTMSLRLAPVNVDERRQFETRGQEVRKFQMERAKLEMKPKAPGKSKEARAVRMQLPASPVAARPMENVEGIKAPPPMPVAPRPQPIQGRGRQMRPQKVETPTEATQTRQEPAKTELRPSERREKPNRLESKPEAITPEPTPRKIEGRPATGMEKPNRLESRPEAVTPEATPQRSAPQTKPAKREKVRVKTEISSPAPRNMERPKSDRMEAKPEGTPVPRRQLQERPKTVEPTRESPGSREFKREVNSQQAEPKAQGPRTNFRKQPNKQPMAPDTDKKRDKKSEER